MANPWFSGANHFSINGGQFSQIQGHQYNMSFAINNSPHTNGEAVDPIIATSNALKCPAPSQYFVGREDILYQLSRTFSPPIVTISCLKENVLIHFVRHYMKWSSAILLDASSLNALNEAQQKYRTPGSLSANTILILENANLSLSIEDYFLGAVWPNVPVLVTSTNHDISKNASSPATAFKISDLGVLQEEIKLFKDVKSALLSRQRIAALVAPGGAGKTQVALKFASENFFRFSNIWFFDATSDATLTANFKELGKAAQVGETIQDVQKFLGQSQNWLCIFDNADDQSVYLKDYIPNCSHGNIIITSRLTESLQIASPGHHIVFNDLDKEIAIDLLLKHAQEESSVDNRNLASPIVDALQCQALAVSTAGAYIHKSTTCTLSNYLSRFRMKRTDMLNYRMKGLDNYQRTIFSAFQISFDKLSLTSQWLIRICSFFHNTTIPTEIFTRAAAFTGVEVVPVDNQHTAVFVMNKFFSLFSAKHSWNDSIDELCQMSLASYNDKDRSLTFHSVIHSCAHETIAQDEIMTMEQAAMMLLGRATPMGQLKKEDYQFRRQLFIHANHMNWENLPTIYTRICFALIFWEAGFGEYSEKLAKQVFLLYKQTLGKEHPDTLTSMSNLADTYRALGKVEVATELQEQVLSSCIKVLHKPHPCTLTAMANLAHIYRIHGKLEIKRALEAQIFTLCEKILEEYPSDTLTSKAQLVVGCWVHRKLKDISDGIEGQKDFLKKDVFQECHHYILTSMVNLASVYQGHGKLKAARELDEQVFSMHRKIHGKCHPDTLKAMANLASTYRACGNLEAATGLEEEALLLRKKILGKYHPDTLRSMANLAGTYCAHGKLGLAEKLESRVLYLRKEILGVRHPNTLTSMANLVVIFWASGKLQAAKKLQKQAFSLHRSVYGERHPDTVSSMAALAATYWACGKLQAAEKLQEQLILINKEIYGKQNDIILSSITSLVCAYLSIWAAPIYEATYRSPKFFRDSEWCHINTD